MKIYIPNYDINTNKLDKYYKYYNDFKIVYSEDGIFKINNNNISKLNITDKTIESISISGTKLYIDKSIISFSNNITTIPLRHKLIDINEIKYKETEKSQLSLIIQYSKNKLIDAFFIINADEIDDNIIIDLTNYLKIIY